MHSLRAIIVSCVIASISAAAEDNLVVIERSLSEQYSSIRSVEVKFRVRRNLSNLNPNQKRPAEFASWEWLLSDTKRLIRREPELLPNGQMSLEWYSFDGRQAYEMWCWQTDGTRPDTIRITSSIKGTYYANAVPEWMWGVTVGEGCDTPVLDWLKRRTPDKVRDLGVEVIDGHECRKVEFDNVPSNGLYRTRAWVWFDAAADWLPRQISCAPLRYFELVRQHQETHPDQKGPVRMSPMSIEPGEAVHAHKVLSFMQVDDPLLGRKRWFPKSGGMSETSVFFEVDSVVINQPIDDSRFVPVAVAGTQIEDQTTQNVPRITIHGGNEGLIARLELVEAQSLEVQSKPPSAVRKNVTPQATPPLVFPAPDARPQRMAWWRPVVAAVGFAMLAVWFRKWMASRS